MSEKPLDPNEIKTPHDLVTFFEHHVTYKPGCQLNAWTDRGEMHLVLNMSYVAPDAVNGGTISLVFTQRYRVSAILGGCWRNGALREGITEAYLDLLRDKFFGTFERHERDEWLKVDGEPVAYVRHT